MIDTLIELIKFIFARKKYWMFPLVLILFLLGMLIILGGGSAVAPFIYTIF